MDKLVSALSASGGMAGLLASLCVLLAFNVLVKVGAFVWQIKRDKDRLTEEGVKALAEIVAVNTATTEKNTQALAQLMLKLPKVELDLKRAFAALRVISGSKWPDIRREIMEEHRDH